MPIYKGSTEVTSGNLHKGSTEVQDGYKAADSFYVNETTLTILFIDNTDIGAIFSGSTIIRTGVPGSSWNMAGASRVDRTSTAYRLSAISSSTANDSGNNVTITNSGSTYFPALGEFYFSGTIPTTSKTVTVTINASTVALAARNMNFNSTGSSNPTPFANWVSYGIAAGGSTWSGGGTATASMGGGVTDVMYSIDAVPGASYVTGSCGGTISQSGMPSGFAPSFRAIRCGSATTSTVTPTMTISIGESSTHQSDSVSTSFTWN